MQIRAVEPRNDPALAPVLLDVQHAAYACEADLIDDDRIPPLHETVEDLCDAALLWHAGFVGGELAGAIGWTTTTDEIDIDRLIVAPPMQRRGVGSTLVRDLIRAETAKSIVVSTASLNAPAIALYQGLGFHQVGNDEVVPGLRVNHYRRPAAGPGERW